VIVHQLTAIGVIDLRHFDRDYAPSTVAAVERAGRGVAADTGRMLGAEQPVQAPRLAAGEAGAELMTETRGACNAKAKRAFGWQPGHPGWRQGSRREAAGGEVRYPDTTPLAGSAPRAARAFADGDARWGERSSERAGRPSAGGRAGGCDRRGRRSAEAGFVPDRHKLARLSARTKEGNV
jgi:hypothetical protein